MALVVNGAFPRVITGISGPGGIKIPVMIAVPAGRFQMGIKSVPAEKSVNLGEGTIAAITALNNQGITYSNGKLVISGVSEDQIGRVEKDLLKNEALPENERTAIKEVFQQSQVVIKDAQPVRLVEVSGFGIGIGPVTNEEYGAYLCANEITGWKVPDDPAKARHPVVGVTWFGAVKYCRWLSGITGRQFRLLIEAEWEYAARGPESRLYPWGNEWDPTKAVFHRPIELGTDSIDSHPEGASWCGALHLAGNVWEWVNDWYDWRGYEIAENVSRNERLGKFIDRHDVSFRYDQNLRSLVVIGKMTEEVKDELLSCFDEKADREAVERLFLRRSRCLKDPQGPKTGYTRVLRGGTWYITADQHFLLSAYRRALDPNYVDNREIGFRVAMTLSD
jgi:formylglycine-generating enzyme required for sulfatase activity